MSATETTAPEAILVTPEQMAAMLSIPRTKAWGLLHGNAIPSFKIGRSRRVRVADVKAWAERQAAGAAV